ncbi:hypothetical protein [Dethiothermospora halolimnae]
MDKIVYTGEFTEEEIIKEINKLLNKFLYEMADKKKNWVDDPSSTQ